jgi:NADH:ubiquinone oxidoreductase subunit 3 (subunit A)
VVLVAFAVIAIVGVAVLVVRGRRGATERDMEAFEAGQQALGRASGRSPRATE